jgi:two-component system, NtrC family, sensor histidine kinase KinB
MSIRFSIRAKMIAAFLLVAALVGLTSYVGINSLKKVHSEYDNIVDVQLPSVKALQDMRALSIGAHAETLQYHDNFAHGGSSEEAVHQKEHIVATLEKLAKTEQEYLGVEAEEAEESEEDESVAHQSLRTAREQMASSVLGLIDLQEKQSSEEIVAEKEEEVTKNQEQMTSTVETILEEEFERIEKGDEAADSEAATAIRRSIMLAGLSVFLALLVGLLMSSLIARRIKKLEEGMTHIAAGDFRHKVVISGKDELAELAKSFNQMSDRLQYSYQRLAFTKQRDEALIESMSEGLIAVDEAGKVVLLNKVAAQLFGLNREEATGKLIITLAKIYDQNNHSLPDEQHPASITLKSGQPVSDVFVYKTQAKKILLSISSNPVILDNKVAGAIVVLRDVTKEKEIDRMKTEFISLASHQLRTPLSAIKWFAEMLVNGDAGKLTDEQLDFAKNISDSTERMIDLVNSLLNISRIESGRIIVDPKPTDLQELVTGIINDLKAKTEDKQQSLIVSVHKELGKINLDPHLIGQVYMNFLTNAIKYTPKGGEISVFISRKDDQVVSQITDNGYGIPKAQQDRLFQKFFRAENIAKIETDGTGLGLYLVKAIIESSGGKVWFESEEDKGTTFWFSLPITGMKAKEGEVTLDV